MTKFHVVVAGILLTFVMHTTQMKFSLRMPLKKDNNNEGAGRSNGIYIKIKQILGQAKSADPVKRLAAIRRAQSLLSTSNGPNELLIDAFILAGCLPIFLDCLKDNNSDDVKLAALSTLANIAGAGTAEQRRAAIGAGALPHFVRLLDSANIDLCRHAIRAVFNLAIMDRSTFGALFQQNAAKVSVFCSIVETKDTKLDAIEGNALAKTTLQRSAVLPLLNPTLFTGLRAPPKAILLFGPPGNGKTMLANAIANECHSTFFSISAFHIMSQWNAEWEKLVRALFQMARNVSRPSFSLMESMHCLTNAFQSRMNLLAATNRPQELDEGILGRFPQRIMVDLPDQKTRGQMIRRIFEHKNINLALTEEELDQIAISTENYSFSDLWALCTEAAFCPIQNAWQNDLLLRHTTPNNLRQVNAVDFKCAMRKVRPAAINAENRKELVEFAEKYAQRNSDNE
ncbi:hypothetical protein niasHT_034428 [Heterodera trifolii]|uniref:AAA+ ATPase domain-containing protein n=1 Tax=Heterodera trifolii TaxID=157864 RepID=A0ABD2I7S4_9BILA